MHIIKFEAGNEFYATAWCGEKVGMLDRAYMSIDNALKAIEHNVGVICPLCLSVVIETAQPALALDAPQAAIESDNSGAAHQ